ncbi:hypothetical protein [Flexivirga alba]|jgi:hypothetical protein|uniref:Uncharacterized protein n=1 Tax=Flexivirga alba TaxID=702742 RepID=A0ABW2AM64_9MICO
MKLISRTAAVALVISLPMALGACGGGSKPSKADVKAGYIKSVKKSGGAESAKIPDSLYTKMADCVFDKTYNDLSSDTLNKFKDGNANEKTKIKSSDKDKLTSASTSCQTKLANDFKNVG